MRHIVFAACVALAASPAHALQWKPIASKPAGVMKYIPESAFVDKLTGRVRVVVCVDQIAMHPGAPGKAGQLCGDPDEIKDVDFVTDAVMDCDAKTVSWIDPLETPHVDTVVTRKRYHPSRDRASATVAGETVHGEQVDDFDLGFLFKRLCAQKASLPRRLTPGSPGAGFVVRLAFGPPGAVIIDRSMVVTAHANLDGARPTVDIVLNETGAKRLADVTSANVGNTLSIVLDGEVVETAVIQAPITGGALSINGDLTPHKAEILAHSITGWSAYTEPEQ
jgi:hypothetical protein